MVIVVINQGTKILRGKKVPRRWLEETLGLKGLFAPPPDKKVWFVKKYLENMLPFADIEIAEIIFRMEEYFGINLDVAGCIAMAKAKGY